MKDIEKDIVSLDKYLNQLEEEFGGDILFYPPISESKLIEAENILIYKFPEIFRWLYAKKNNGLKIDNKSIIGIYDEKNKKTFVENIIRYNDPSKELFFKEKNYIFDDYIIIGYDHTKLLCISKKYEYPNPLLYVCKNPNSVKEINFFRTNFNLENCINNFIQEAYGDEISDDWVLK